MSVSKTGLRVIFSFPHGQLGGVDVYTVHLVRGLQARGVPVQIVLTQPEPCLDNPFPFPDDLPVEKLPLRTGDLWPTRWRTMVRYLEDRAPCIYIPNYDYMFSCISPRLADAVRVVGIVHGDDPVTYAHMLRLGRYWNAIIAVSPAIGEKAANLAPALAPRIVTIANGVPIPEELKPRVYNPTNPLKVVYAGRLAHYQKRILDLARIAALTDERNLPIEFVILGSGPDAAQLKRLCAPLVERGRVRFAGIVPNQEALGTFETADVLILTSEFEGFSISLLEAMARGCIPVVTNIRSGIPELVVDGENGYRVAIGDIEGFVARLGHLARDPELRRTLSRNAYRTVRESKYHLGEMVDQYIGLFDCVAQQLAFRAYRRPRSSIVPPQELKWQARLPEPVWVVGHHVKRILRNVIALAVCRRDPRSLD